MKDLITLDHPDCYRFEMRLESANLETHTWLTKHPEVWPLMVQQVRMGLQHALAVTSGDVRPTVAEAVGQQVALDSEVHLGVD